MDQDVAILLVEMALLFGETAVVCGVLVVGCWGEFSGQV